MEDVPHTLLKLGSRRGCPWRSRRLVLRVIPLPLARHLTERRLTNRHGWGVDGLRGAHGLDYMAYHYI